MTDKEKQLLTKALLSFKKLIRSQKDTTAKRYAEEITDAVSKLLDGRNST